MNRHIKTVLHVVPVLMAAALISACAPLGMNSDMGGSSEMPVPEPDTILVQNPMSRPSPMTAGNGAAYMTILNGFGSDVQLVSAESEASNVVELHETVDDNGVMRMQPRPEGFTVPAGGMVELKPGGKHVMLIDLVEPLEPGKQLEITLNFDNGESLTVTVPVTEMSGEMPMNMEHEESSE
jgi:copper(I)-binding protein